MIDERIVDCPYCGEAFIALIDYSAGAQTYIEDCEVCCRPIVFQLSIDADGQLLSVETRRDDD